MKKWLVLIPALLAVGYFVKDYQENEVAKEQKKAERRRERGAVATSISEMTSKWGAVKDWDVRLTRGRPTRTEPILSVELEQAWIGEKPVVFYGSIADVATIDQTHYRVIVGGGLANIRQQVMLRTPLYLSLIADKEKIDSLLQKHSSVFDAVGFRNSFAVIAKVASISFAFGANEEASEGVRVGTGHLLDIAYAKGAEPTAQNDNARRNISYLDWGR